MYHSERIYRVLINNCLIVSMLESRRWQDAGSDFETNSLLLCERLAQDDMAWDRILTVMRPTSPYTPLQNSIIEQPTKCCVDINLGRWCQYRRRDLQLASSQPDLGICKFLLEYLIEYH